MHCSERVGGLEPYQDDGAGEFERIVPGSSARRASDTPYDCVNRLQEILRSQLPHEARRAGFVGQSPELRIVIASEDNDAGLRPNRLDTAADLDAAQSAR